MAMSGIFCRARVAATLVAASVVFAATACGSSGDTSGSPSSSGASASGGTIRVGTDATYPPYEYKEGNEYKGFEIDIARAYGRALNKNIEFVDVKYAVAPAGLAAKRFDVAMTGGGPDRPEFRQQYTMVDWVYGWDALIVPKGNPDGLGTLASLCGRTVSVFAGTSQFDRATKQNVECGDRPINILSLSDANGPFSALQTGRADAYMGDYIQAVYQSNLMGTDVFKVTDAEPYLSSSQVAVENVEMAQELAHGLQQIIDSGEAAKIAEAHGIPADVLVKTVTINDGEIPVRSN